MPNLDFRMRSYKGLPVSTNDSYNIVATLFYRNKHFYKNVGINQIPDTV